MTEEEARSRIVDRWGIAKFGDLQRYVEMLLAENQRQNLISKASETVVWQRHILDSAQLIRFAPEARTWLDIGSGPGLPGVVIAILTGTEVHCVEPRRKRIEFLERVTATLGLAETKLICGKVGKVTGRYQAITARAFAAATETFESAFPLASAETIWVLPRGTKARQELADVRQSWQGVFHVEHSVTDEESEILIAKNVRPARS